MIDFLVNNLDFILTFIVAAIVCIIMARRGQIKKIKEIVLALCVNAEITYGGGTFVVYRDSYDVIQVSGDRVVIGVGNAVTAAVHINDLEKI